MSNTEHHEESPSQQEGPRIHLVWRLALGFAVITLGLWLALWAGRLGTRLVEDLPWLAEQAIQAAVASGIVIPGIYLLRRKIDRRALAGVGLGQPARAARDLLLGFGIIVAILALPLLVITVAGWGSLSVDASTQTLAFLAAALTIAFFFEAFPEEVAVRGYLYRNLSAVMARWAAALIGLGLFVLIPLMLALGFWLLEIEADMGGQSSITVGYIMIIVLFGGIIQYLRVVTGSVWICIGFHLAFLMIGRWFGPGEDAFIRIEAHDPAKVDLLLQTGVLVGVFALLLYPFIVRKRIGWREADQE